ncbi:NADH dehydrogenase [ubiquinone] 1 alpha subcomplex subunit 6 isoform X2 [Rhineura floridana]|uniref:NADH dehydrogenase [ubiquinone] 1 alpha subcomplex subunit 6 isoform X2 n=1 Tax=Rhineura floridana TaxID=261503 RepID=UPI002AC7F27D|nr:NADH dehydrogenase [ubiquinone] 1 alpha subcomplex subunit 6 isoform X2 [Rhineura floridana]
MAAAGARKVAAAAGAVVKPIFSRDLAEAKRRVRELYRAWYREIPNTGEEARLGPRPLLQGRFVGLMGQHHTLTKLIFTATYMKSSYQKLLISETCTFTSWISQ